MSLIKIAIKGKTKTAKTGRLKGKKYFDSFTTMNFDGVGKKNVSVKFIQDVKRPTESGWLTIDSKEVSAPTKWFEPGNYADEQTGEEKYRQPTLWIRGDYKFEPHTFVSKAREVTQDAFVTDEEETEETSITDADEEELED